MRKIAKWISSVIGLVGKVELPEDKERRLNYLKEKRGSISTNKELAIIAKDVKKLASKFPVPGI